MMPGLVEHSVLTCFVVFFVVVSGTDKLCVGLVWPSLFGIPGHPSMLLVRSDEIFGFEDQCKSSIGFGCALYFVACSKAVSSGKHFLRSSTGYVTLTSWTLTFEHLHLLTYTIVPSYQYKSSIS